MSVDCLLVHVPKLLEYLPYVGWYSRINFLSMGIFSIAEELERCGLRCRIVHVGVEKQRDPGFSLARYVRDSGAKVVAFALHWHPQTFDTLWAAEQLKAAVPEVKVVLGGLTASYFAADILREFPFVDAVIRGEAEKPLAQYVAAVRAGSSDLAEVQNLTFREGDAVRQQPVTFTTSAEDMNGWSFAAWRLLEHPDGYLEQNWRNSWEPEYRGQTQPEEPTLFGAALGRGCMGTCTWCAGSFAPTKIATGRRRTAWRSADRIADTLRQVQQYGIRRVYTCFDPLPNRMRELFELLAVLGTFSPKIALDFETFGLPQPEFIDAFAQNLAPSSRLIISPETADEALRRRHRAFPFTNAELDAALAHMARLGVRTELYFIIGLPGDDRASIERTAEYQRELQQRFPNIERSHTWPLEMEPNSPWFLHPERYGLTLRHRTLRDFYEAHRQPEMALGYDLPNLTEKELLALHEELFLPLSHEERAALRHHHESAQRDYGYVRNHA